MTQTPVRNDYPPTPNLDKMIAVSEESQPIGEFVEWLHSQGWQIARYGPVTQEIPCPSDDGYFATCQGGVVYKGTHKERPCIKCDGTGWIEVTRDGWQPSTKSIEALLADYFGIDKAAADREREAVLKHLQARNASKD